MSKATRQVQVPYLLVIVTVGFALAAALLALLTGAPAPVVHAQAGSGAIRVAPTGLDVAGCGSVAAPCKTVQFAVDQAVTPGTEVLIAQGLYTGTAARVSTRYSGVVSQVVFISKSLTLRGGYDVANWNLSDPIANPTILDAQGKGRVLFVESPDGIPIEDFITPTVEGLHITGGDATALPGGFGTGAATGGGVNVVAANVVISGNLIYDNTANRAGPPARGGLGGGIYLGGSLSLLNDNRIYDNRATDDIRVDGFGGGLVAMAGRLNLTRNLIQTNTATYSGTLGLSGGGGGGGIWILEMPVTMQDNVIEDNVVETLAPGSPAAGGGLYMDGGGFTPLRMTNDIVRNNRAERGGGIELARTAAWLTNTVVISNMAAASGLPGPGSLGAGIVAAGSLLEMKHSTVANNTGGDGSGLLVTDYTFLTGRAAVTNAIFAYQSVGVSVSVGSRAEISSVLWYSNSLNYGGMGTIMVTGEYTGDPRFHADGYHIKVPSTAVGKGIDAGVTFDIDGQPRPLDGSFELGADEIYAVPVPAQIIIRKRGPAIVNSGAPITYTLTVTNGGLGPATNLLITDTLPANASYVTGGARVGNVVSWTVPSLGAGGASVDNIFVVTATRTITNDDYRVSADGAISFTGRVPVVTQVRMPVSIEEKVYLPLILKN